MSTNTALDDIGARIRACKPCDFGLRHANKLAHEDAPKLLAALEAVQALPEYDTWEHHAIGMGEVFGAGYAHALEVVRDVIEEALR